MASKTLDQGVLDAEGRLTRWMTFWARISWEMKKTISSAMMMVLATPTALMGTENERMVTSMHIILSMQSEEQLAMVDNHSCINHFSLAAPRGEATGDIYVGTRYRFLWVSAVDWI